MEDLIDKSGLNATDKSDKFNSSQRTKRRRFFIIYFAKTHMLFPAILEGGYKKTLDKP
jgi:hypothetical protein